jgi:hypothetical protein
LQISTKILLVVLNNFIYIPHTYLFMGMPELTSDMSSMAGLSPKKVAAIATLRMFEKYFDFMTNTYGIEGATAALLITCTEKPQREAMWKRYTDERDKQDGNLVTASVYSVGDWYQYQCNAMGLNEQSTGGG